MIAPVYTLVVQDDLQLVAYHLPRSSSRSPAGMEFERKGRRLSHFLSSECDKPNQVAVAGLLHPTDWVAFLSAQNQSVFLRLEVHPEHYSAKLIPCGIRQRERTEPSNMASVMTLESLEEMQLKKGDKVEVIVKAVHVLLVKH